MHPPASRAEISRETARTLLSRARDARRHSYSPYSNFAVGAALLTEAGEVYTGCNVENASYGLTICAERTAIAKAISEGERTFRAIAVVGPQDDASCAPCGSCRQVIYEFGPELLVITPGGEGEPHVSRIADLLPGAFGSAQLRAGGGVL